MVAVFIFECDICGCFWNKLEVKKLIKLEFNVYVVLICDYSCVFEEHFGGMSSPAPLFQHM